MASKRIFVNLICLTFETTPEGDVVRKSQGEEIDPATYAEGNVGFRVAFGAFQGKPAQITVGRPYDFVDKKTEERNTGYTPKLQPVSPGLAKLRANIVLRVADAVTAKWPKGATIPEAAAA